ncbi:MAG: LysR family transcriptional regulator [Rhizobiales bacterium]|nr:LysR family transcriptional regulator [Hyphomicrobiales bacterium]
MSHINSVTLKQLRALAAVHKNGSITAAADALNLTVPAVSTQLKTLEMNIGVELVIRSNEMKGIDGRGGLTPQGQEVLATTIQIEAALNHCAKTIETINAGKSGYVSLGVVSTGKYFAPRIVALANKILPDIRINLVINNRSGLIKALEDGSIDFAIMGRPPRYPIVDFVPLAEHPHILISPPLHPLVREKNISFERLLKETFILREEGSGTRLLTERYLDRIGHGSPYEKIEFNTNETVKQAVIAGLGIALISGHTVQDGLSSGQIGIIKMQGLPIMRRWYLVRLTNARITPITEKVREFLVEEEERYLPKLPNAIY